jgi:hypothetical protein
VDDCHRVALPAGFGYERDMIPVCLLDDHEVVRRGLRSMDPSIDALVLTSYEDDEARFARDLTEHGRWTQAAVLASRVLESDKP